MSTDKPPFKRWYDRHPRLAQGVKLLIIMPDEVKTIISEAMIALANKEFVISEQENTFRTMGSERVMGLHKSKNRRREYDVNETLHKAMNYLYMLSDDGQDFMSDHILNIVKYIQEYFSTCKEFKVSSKPEEVAELTETYVSSGKEGVQQFLAKLREEFYLKVFSPDNGVKISIDLLETIQNEKSPPSLQSPALQSPESLESLSSEKAPPSEDALSLASKDNRQGMKLSKLEID